MKRSEKKGEGMGRKNGGRGLRGRKDERMKRSEKKEEGNEKNGRK